MLELDILGCNPNGIWETRHMYVKNGEGRGGMLSDNS